MRIAIFTDLFLPHVDGVTNSLVHLISQYKKLGHEVLVVTPKMNTSESISIDGVKIIFLPSISAVVYPEFMLGFFSSELFFFLKNFSPEIVHVIAPGPVGNIGLFYSKLANIKSVATFHGYFMEPEYLRIIGIKKRGVRIAQRVLWRLTKVFYDRANIVITPSKYVKKDLEAHNFIRPIKVIKNAVDFSGSTVNQLEKKLFLKKYKLEGKKVAIYIGRVSIEKNISLLISIVPELARRIPNFVLLIIGDGPDMKRLQAMVDDLKVRENVVFTGEIENSELITKGVFESAQVFVTASGSEVQPMSIIEAMTFGLPIVASKSKGLTEMVTNNGFLVEHNDTKQYIEKISSVLNSERLQKRFSDNSIELSNEYSLEKTARDHLKIYSYLIQDKDKQSLFFQVLSSRIISSYRNTVVIFGTIHIAVLVYLAVTKNDLDYFNIFSALGISELLPQIFSRGTYFIYSLVIVIGLYLVLFGTHKKKD